MSKIIRLTLFSFGLLLLFGLVYRVGFYKITEVIKEPKLFFLFLGILVYLILILIRSFKWFLLIRMIKNRIKYQQFVPLYLANSLMGNITPFKSGETITPFLFKKYLKIPVGQGFSVVIFDRFFELLIFTIILILSVFYVLNQQIQNILTSSVFRGMLIAFFLLLAVFITIIISKRITLKIVRFFRVLRFVEKELDSFYNALSLFRNKKAYQLIIPLTLISWFLDVLAYYLVFSSVFHFPFIDVVIAQIIATSATFVTFMPGGVGVAEVSVVYILSLMGHSVLLATSGVLLVRLFLTGTLLITGLVGSILIRK